MSLPTEDRYLQTAGELRGRMAMMLGGRTAEEIVVGEVTIEAHRVELDALCALLIERESVDEDDLLRIFAQG